MGGCKPRFFAQNVDAVLVVTVISAVDAIFAKFHKQCLKPQITRFKVYGMLFFPEVAFCLRSAVDSEGPGPGPGPGSGPGPWP